MNSVAIIVILPRPYRIKEEEALGKCCICNLNIYKYNERYQKNGKMWHVSCNKQLQEVSDSSCKQ